MGELVVKVVDAAGVGAHEEAVFNELGADVCLVDAVEEVLDLLGGEVAGGGGRGLEGVSCHGEALGGGGLERDDAGGEFAVDGDGVSAEANEGVDVAEVASAEFCAVEFEGVGRRECRGGELLRGGVGGFGEKDSGEGVEFGGADACREEAVEVGEEDDGEGGVFDAAALVAREVKGGLVEGVGELGRSGDFFAAAEGGLVTMVGVCAWSARSQTREKRRTAAWMLKARRRSGRFLDDVGMGGMNGLGGVSSCTGQWFVLRSCR